MSPMLDVNEGRDVQVSSVLLGHIKLGIYNGRHPEQIDTFRFTSTDRIRLDPLARDFGGEVRPFRAQGAGTDTWELITERDAFTATFAFPQTELCLAQDYKLWKRSGLQRICDGYSCTVYTVDEETGEREGEETSCICSAKAERECAGETRLRFILAQTGLGVWELTTGSKYAAPALFDQVRVISGIADGRMNQLPIRVVYAPREISYRDPKDGVRKRGTKRIVSLSIAGDAISVLQALQLEPARALFSAVETALHDAGRELGSGSVNAPALGAGDAPDPHPLGHAAPSDSHREQGEGSEPEEPGQDAGSDPDLDEPAPTEAWERLQAAGCKGPTALKIARRLFPDAGIRSMSDITKRQIGDIFTAYVEGDRG